MQHLQSQKGPALLTSQLVMVHHTSKVCAAVASGNVAILKDSEYSIVRIQNLITWLHGQAQGLTKLLLWRTLPKSNVRTTHVWMHGTQKLFALCLW